jgi:phosphoserine phosphatase RsbU/P
VPKPIPEYLKLHATEPTTTPPLAGGLDLSSVEVLCCAFERATGWHLRYESPALPRSAAHSTAVANGAGLVLTPAQRGEGQRLPRQDVEHLAAAIAILLGELEQTRHALTQREADLAAGVPVSPRSDEAEHLAERLAAALQAAVQAVGGAAAALYLLDEGTSELKLRASFRLPAERLLEPARPLRGAIADLEALLGHAVVIEDTSLLPHWRCPEDYPAAMCVPVSSPSTPLGTLWIFSDEARDFTPEQTNLVEIVAGRIAADLDREVLLAVGAESKSAERDLHEAARWQEEHLPTIAPLIDDWDVAGTLHSAGELTSEFFDWTVLQDGHLAIALGDAHGRAVTAGLSAAALQATLKSHANYRHDARQMLERINDSLWTSSPGGQYASLGYGLISPDDHLLEIASAGRLGAVLVHREGHTALVQPSPPLGSDPDLLVTPRRQQFRPESALVLFSDGVLFATDPSQRPWDDEAVAEFVRRQLHLSAEELVARLRSALGPIAGMDRTLLIVKRLR